MICGTVKGNRNMGLKEIFKKQGGLNLIKQYHESGVLKTALGEIFLLGRDKKALEILRLSVQFKVKQRLEKKYKRQIQYFDENYKDKKIHEKSNKVWVCWFQGLENAPELVKKCYKSLQANLTDREIILITSENMDQYVKFPKFILEKWEKGYITNTHMTDLLRLELLIYYGGMWIDSTVLCTRKIEEISEYYFDSDLFFYQLLKPGRDGQAQLISSWLMSAKTNNKILIMTRYLCYEYWKKNTKMMDYFLLHDFMSIALEHNPDEWNKVIPRDNATPHILLLRLFDKYEERLWNSVVEQTPFHKLTYKFDECQTNLSNTFYQYIINN